MILQLRATAQSVSVGNQHFRRVMLEKRRVISKREAQRQNVVAVESRHTSKHGRTRVNTGASQSILRQRNGFKRVKHA